jgi:hypothetical protein
VGKYQPLLRIVSWNIKRKSAAHWTALCQLSGHARVLSVEPATRV